MKQSLQVLTHARVIEQWLSTDHTRKNYMACFHVLTGVTSRRIENMVKQAQHMHIAIKRHANRSSLIQASSSAARSCALVIEHGKTHNQKRVSGLEKTVQLEQYCAHLKVDEDACVLLLDKITDPHNLGAIMRSACQLGVAVVITPRHNSARMTDVVMQTSAGAALHITHIVVPNLANALDVLKKYEFWVYASALSGTPIDQVHFAHRSVIIMGNEGSGISPLLLKKSDEIIQIPTTGIINSLNVSVASGIILYEYARQNKFHFL